MSTSFLKVSPAGLENHFKEYNSIHPESPIQRPNGGFGAYGLVDLLRFKYGVHNNAFVIFDGVDHIATGRGNVMTVLKDDKHWLVINNKADNATYVYAPPFSADQLIAPRILGTMQSDSRDEVRIIGSIYAQDGILRACGLIKVPGAPPHRQYEVYEAEFTDGNTRALIEALEADEGMLGRAHVSAYLRHPASTDNCHIGCVLRYRMIDGKPVPGSETMVFLTDLTKVMSCEVEMAPPAHVKHTKHVLVDSDSFLVMSNGPRQRVIGARGRAFLYGRVSGRVTKYEVLTKHAVKDEVIHYATDEPITLAGESCVNDVTHTAFWINPTTIIVFSESTGLFSSIRLSKGLRRWRGMLIQDNYLVFSAFGDGEFMIQRIPLDILVPGGQIDIAVFTREIPVKPTQVYGECDGIVYLNREGNLSRVM